MKKIDRYIIPILFALIMGFISAFYIYKEYKSNNIYYIQIGAYSSLNNLNNNLSSIANKIILKDDNLYHAYVGITTSSDNAKKIKDYYERLGKKIYIKEMKVKNDNFKIELAQYDILLKNAQSDEEIKNILETIIARYNEIYNNT